MAREEAYDLPSSRVSSPFALPRLERRPTRRHRREPRCRGLSGGPGEARPTKTRREPVQRSSGGRKDCRRPHHRPARRRRASSALRAIASSNGSSSGLVLGLKAGRAGATSSAGSASASSWSERPKPLATSRAKSPLVAVERQGRKIDAVEPPTSRVRSTRRRSRNPVRPKAGEQAFRCRSHTAMRTWRSRAVGLLQFLGEGSPGLAGRTPRDAKAMFPSIHRSQIGRCSFRG